MLEFLWEYQQSRRITETEVRGNRAASVAREARLQADDAERRLDTLTLAVMGMWSIMVERLGVTETELVRRMEAIDLRDGKLDGKVSPTATTCTSCHRAMSSRYKRCLYCGGESLSVGPFGGV